MCSSSDRGRIVLREKASESLDLSYLYIRDYDSFPNVTTEAKRLRLVIPARLLNKFSGYQHIRKILLPSTVEGQVSRDDECYLCHRFKSILAIGSSRSVDTS